MSEAVTYEQQGRVVVLTLDRPGTRNALDTEMVEAIVGACARIDTDPGVSCVVLRSSGPAFCSGGNVKEMQAGVAPFGGSPADMRLAYRQGIHRIPRAVYGLEVPVIAVVDGPAIGAGCDLALMCDMRLATPRAVFAESFIRLGLVSGDGGAWLLPRVIGGARAAEMTFSGEPVDAQRALAWGLVGAVHPPEDVMAQALSLAAKIARHPAQSIRLNKRLLREAERSTLDQTLEIAGGMQALAQSTSDFHEAVAAFVERRDPHYTGR